MGEREKLWEHEPKASVSTDVSSSLKLSRVLITITLWKLGKKVFNKHLETFSLWSGGFQSISERVVFFYLFIYFILFLIKANTVKF